MRPNGFYFVRYANKWIIAEYNKIDPDHNWRIPGQNGKFCDCDFTEIDERVMTKEAYDMMQSGYNMLNSFKKAADAYREFIKLHK